MTWFVVLGFISILLILAGCGIAVKRIRRYLEETEKRRARAFAEMMEIAEKKNAERSTQNAVDNLDPRP